MFPKEFPVWTLALLFVASLFPCNLCQAENNPPSSHHRKVGIATLRIERGREQILVFRKGKAVVLPRFIELVVAVPLAREAGLENLVGKSITIVRSKHGNKQWDIYTDVAWKGTHTLPDNVFVVRRAFVSSRKFPIVITVDGHRHTLKAGQVLLVLG